jgi:hypothetical protein
MITPPVCMTCISCFMFMYIYIYIYIYIYMTQQPWQRHQQRPCMHDVHQMAFMRSTHVMHITMACAWEWHARAYATTWSQIDSPRTLGSEELFCGFFFWLWRVRLTRVHTDRHAWINAMRFGLKKFVAAIDGKRPKQIKTNGVCIVCTSLQEYLVFSHREQVYCYCWCVCMYAWHVMPSYPSPSRVSFHGNKRTLRWIICFT